VGRYVAKSLLDAGAYVACISKNKALLENLTKQYPGQGFAFPYDISDPDITNICFKKVRSLGHI
jgi:NADP-dependent 3-hydroxy acid dehydrogenase YdfG